MSEMITQPGDWLLRKPKSGLADGRREMKAAVYARVSTGQQELANQLLELQKWADHRGLEIIEVYQEQESAWRNGHQQELSRLLVDARRGKFKIVLVWALDRLSREGPLVILSLVNRLGRHGVVIWSLKEPWTETGSPEMSELLFSLTGWIAKQESIRRSERTKAGLARAVANGQVLGRPQGSKDRKKRKRRRSVEGHRYDVTV